MELVIKSRHAKLSDRQRTHISEKIGKLERYMALSKATVELSEEQRRNEGSVFRVQVTLVGEHGVLLRSEQYAPELYMAVDEVHDTLQRQITRYKDKHWRRSRARQGDQFVVPEPEPSEETNGTPVPRIVRTKEFQIKPMFSDEAVEQMELLGHDFFIFRDADHGGVNILYRRKDGNYGLIVPDVAE